MAGKKDVINTGFGLFRRDERRTQFLTRERRPRGGYLVRVDEISRLAKLVTPIPPRAPEVVDALSRPDAQGGQGADHRAVVLLRPPEIVREQTRQDGITGEFGREPFSVCGLI